MVGVAIVGFGLAGRTFHAPVIARTPGYVLRAIVTSKDEGYGDARLVRSVEDVLADSSVQLVVVATPNTTHAPIAIQALKAGKHVVIDKPFATSVAEAERVADVARSSGRVLAVFHNRRWDADFLALRALRDSGVLGDIVEVRSHLDRYRPDVRKRWREEPGPGAGLWFDLGPHLVDQALQLFGPPKRIDADIAALREGAQVDDYFDVTLRYDRLRVHLHGTALAAWNTQRFVVHGTKASWVKNGIDPQENQLKAGRLPGDPGWGDDPIAGELVTPEGTRPTPTLSGDFRSFYAGLHAAITEGAAPPVTIEESLAVMRVLETATNVASRR